MPAERFHLGSAEILVGADVNEAARIAAGQFAALARNIAGQGKPFHVALSGGHGPRPLFQLLASEPLRSIIPWEALRVFWGDERDVSPGDADSNYRMARELLLSRVPIQPAHIHRIPTGDGTAIDAAELYQRTLRDLIPVHNGLPQLDYNLLGLGTNGHTASLFPHRPTLHEQHRLVVADHIEEVGWRVTLTVPVLNNAAQITFLATGEEKAQAVQRILEGAREPEAAPAQMIAPAGGGSLSWILDAAAASLLSRPGSELAAS